MRFEMKRRLEGASAPDANPVSAPGAVLDEAILRCPLTMRNSDTIPARLLLTLAGTVANTVVVEIWALDEIAPDRGASLPERLTQAEKALREFTLCTPVTTLTVTVGEMLEFPAVATDVMPLPNAIYVRVTSKPAADAVLKVACGN